jgi:uncharacterized RDD family membrane protein YckC
MNWHYVEQGQQFGPVVDEQLLKLFREGKITADSLVWREGLPDWIPFHEAKLEPGSSPPSTAPPPLPAPNSSEVVCAECGGIFPAGETIAYGNVRVCAACKPAFLQKLAEGARVNTGELNYAGFGVRVAARLVDGLILGLPCLFIIIAVMMPAIRSSVANHSSPPQFPGNEFLPLLLNIGFIIVQISYQIFFLGKFGATPGKMLCKLQVVTAEGQRFGYGRAAGRAAAEMLSGMICYIGYLMVLFDSQKRALHDHICNTRVVYK